jgi:multiple sugar transport system permease protein/raffinose/stachyose/melibiose transport system permease protein
MILPFFAFFFSFVLIPIALNFINSFTNADLSSQKEYVGLKNYIRLLNDEDFIRSAINTSIYAVFSVFPLAVLGFTAAVAVNRKSTVIKAARVFFIFPYVTSMVAVSMIWLLILEPSGGILNKLLILLGGKPLLWLFDEKLALPSLIVMNIWKNIGYVMIIYLAGLQSIPRHLYESATVDGASDRVKLVKITIPMLSNITFFVFITLCFEAFKTFDQVRIMTGGGPVNSTTTIVHQIYLRAFTEFEIGYASSMSIVLLILTFAVTMLNFKIGSKRSNNG